MTPTNHFDLPRLFGALLHPCCKQSSKPVAVRMNNFGLILRSVVWFLFPLPWLLSFAMEHGEDWTAWVAYIAIVVLVLAAVVSGWVAIRRNR